MIDSRIREAASHLARHLAASPRPARVAVTVLFMLLLGWPNVIYVVDAIPTAFQPA